MPCLWSSPAHIPIETQKQNCTDHPACGHTRDLQSITSICFLSSFLVVQFVFWTAPGFLCFHRLDTMSQSYFQVEIAVLSSIQKLRETAPSPWKVSGLTIHQKFIKKWTLCWKKFPASSGKKPQSSTGIRLNYEARCHLIFHNASFYPEQSCVKELCSSLSKMGSLCRSAAPISLTMPLLALRPSWHQLAHSMISQVRHIVHWVLEAVKPWYVS